MRTKCESTECKELVLQAAVQTGLTVLSSLWDWLPTVSFSASSFSPDKSSKDLPFVSGTKNVMKKPTPLMIDSSKNEFFTPIPLGYPGSCCPVCCPWAAYKNPKAPTIAPALPAAAERPWQVDLNLAGKSSAGTMNVVAFGPKLAKKKVNAYKTMKAMWFPPQYFDGLLGQGWPRKW